MAPASAGHLLPGRGSSHLSTSFLQFGPDCWPVASHGERTLCQRPNLPNQSTHRGLNVICSRDTVVTAGWTASWPITSRQVGASGT